MPPDGFFPDTSTLRETGDRETGDRHEPLITCLIVTAAFAIPGAERGDAGLFVPGVAGTWEITGTLDSNPCGTTDPFVNITTITRDGKTTNADPLPGTSVGEVYRLGRNQYARGLFGFIAPGVQFEVQATCGSINPGEFGAKYRTVISNRAGLVSDCVHTGKVGGVRLVPMPFRGSGYRP